MITPLSLLHLWCYYLRTLSCQMGTVGGGPMIGNNRSTSTPNVGEKKFHEHQAMVLWIGGRVESLVGSVIGGMAWVTTNLIAL